MHDFAVITVTLKKEKTKRRFAEKQNYVKMKKVKKAKNAGDL
jgi:hypothetical protein